MEKLFPAALTAGVDPVGFWDLTIGEIAETIKADTERRRENMRERAAMDYRLASLIAGALSGHMKSFYDMYAELFEEEAKQAAAEQLKAYMLEYMNYNNSKRKRGEANG